MAKCCLVSSPPKKTGEALLEYQAVSSGGCNRNLPARELGWEVGAALPWPHAPVGEFPSPVGQPRRGARCR